MEKTIDLTNKIERLEALEERAGVTLESLSAFLKVYDHGASHLEVHGELRPIEGFELKESIKLVMAVYDSSGRIMGSDHESFDPEDFYALEIFYRCFGSLNVTNISKIRIFTQVLARN